MKYLILALLMASCNKSSIVVPEKSCTVTESRVMCPDGTYYEIPQPIPDSNDVVLSIYNVEKGHCIEVAVNIYVENLSNGNIFDVYYNDSCSDDRGEYCDNVQTSFGSSGDYGHGGRGSSTVCWAGNTQVSGVKNKGGSINIYVIGFR